MIGCNIRNLVNKCERDEKSAINSDFKSPRLNNESAKALVAPEILSRKKKKIPIKNCFQYLLANKLVENKLDHPVIEFAYQGPLLKYHGDKINIVITGDVNFKIRRNKTAQKKTSFN